MKKKLDTVTITNELKGQSLYFEDQSERLAQKANANETAVEKETSPATISKETPKSKETANGRTGERTNARTDERSNERAHERTHEQVNTRTDERANERTQQPAKTENRETSPANMSERITIEPQEKYKDRPISPNANKAMDNPDNPNSPENIPVMVPTRQSQPVKRIIKRHSFQFYVDQIEDLKRLQAKYQFQGLDVQLSELVRDAVSEYLARAYVPVNTTPRTDERTNE